MRVYRVQIADEIHEQGAPPQRASLCSAAKLLVDDAVLDRPETGLLVDQPPRSIDVSRAQHTRSEPQAVEHDADQLVERGGFRRRKIDALPDFRFHPVGQAQMDDT